jgi:hypothetical protein
MVPIKRNLIYDKNLNEATVKRSELIDFLKWADNSSLIRIVSNEENILNEYEKSINEAKRN